MRCHICDTDSDSVTFNREEHTFSPCSECQTVIYETVISYETVESDDEIVDEEFDVGC